MTDVELANDLRIPVAEVRPGRQHDQPKGLGLGRRRTVAARASPDLALDDRRGASDEERRRALDLVVAERALLVNGDLKFGVAKEGGVEVRLDVPVSGAA